MRHYHIYFFAALLLSLYSCRDEYNTDDLNEPQKLSVCCFPSTSDTTWIEVSYSIPVKNGATYTDDMRVRHPQINYFVDGNPAEVFHKDDNKYYVTMRQQPGDHIRIEVSAEGFESVTAETVIPEAVPVKANILHEVKVYSEDWGEFRTYDQVTATFTDPAETKDYYAIRVRTMNIQGYAYGRGEPYYNDYGELDYRSSWYLGGSSGSYAEYLSNKEQMPDVEWYYELRDTIYTYPEVYNESEPLLNPLSEMDSDFGFGSNFYQRFYIFSDATINGSTYTLHLNISPYEAVDGYEFIKEYQVQLYRITPEFYRYLKSINDIDNNELAQGGFSMLSPSVTNVTNGIGIVGGYNVAESNWLVKSYR